MNKKLVLGGIVSALAVASFFSILNVHEAKAVDTLYDQSDASDNIGRISNRNDSGAPSDNCASVKPNPCNQYQYTFEATQAGAAETALINIYQVYSNGTTTYQLNITGTGIGTGQCIFRSQDYPAYSSGYSQSPTYGAGEIDLDIYPATSTCPLATGITYTANITQLIYGSYPSGFTAANTIEAMGDDSTSPDLPRLRIQTGPDQDLGEQSSFAFVNFTPPLQGRTLRDWGDTYYSVQYSMPTDIGFDPPWYVRVMIATSTVTTTMTTWVDNGVASVYRYGTWTQNIPKSALPNGAYYYRVSISTSTNSWTTWVAATTGTFNINASSTDFVTPNGNVQNPSIVEGINNVSSTISDAEAALNCDQYAFISEYDAYITDFPFFATSTPQRVMCEVKAFTLWNIKAIFLPGFVADETGLAVLDGSASLTANIQEFQYTLPFSIYFTSIDAIRNGVRDEEGRTINALSFKLPSTMSLDPATFQTVNALSSTTITDWLGTSDYCDAACATEIKDTYLGIMSKIMWALASVTAIFILL